MADPQPPENRQAGAEPIVTAPPVESTPDDRLRPDTFDSRITTDAEVERLRSSVSQQLLEAAAASAELNLDQTRVKHLQNFDEQRIALNALGQVEQAAADIAVIGF